MSWFASSPKAALLMAWTCSIKAACSPRCCPKLPPCTASSSRPRITPKATSGPALIARVSAERVRDELVRILTEGGAAYGLDLLDQSGLLATLLPEIAAMHGVEI